MAELFNGKYFNEEAFGKYMSVAPNVRFNKLLECKAVVSDKRLADAFVNKTQTGTVYAVLPYFGLIGGTPENYDGETDIVPSSTDTYNQGVFTYGRMKGWTEADFSYDVTGGTDFMANVRSQITRYWNDINQDTILAILQGVFNMADTGTGNIKTANAEFVNKHTYDITDKTDKEITATTLNSCIQQACGDNKQRFSMVICHSTVATNLENLNLLNYLKYTDENGVQRDLSMGTWNGRLVIIDDTMPAEEIPTAYVKTTDTALADGKTYYTRSGSSGNYTYTVVEAPDAANIGSYYEGETFKTRYTTYVLGEGAIGFEEVGAMTPYEIYRDAKTKGGQTTLISRKRNAVSVAGVSYLKKVQSTNSPTNAELKNGLNWSLVSNNTGTINHKAVPLARIISLG